MKARFTLKANQASLALEVYNEPPGDLAYIHVEYGGKGLITIMLRKSEARAIASALMGAAAEL